MAKLKKRADGRYQMNVFIGMEGTTKKYKTVYGKTIKETESKAREIKYKLGKGLNMLDGSITFEELTQRWLAYKKPLLKESQYKSYVTNLKPFESLNKLKIGDLVKENFQSIISYYAEENPHTGNPTAKQTLRAYRLTARQVFDYAVENRIIEYNPVAYVKIPKDAPKSERRALTEEEQQWIISTEHRAKLPAMIMMLSGLRLGECLALQWRDVDLKSKQIYVHQKLLMKGSKPIIEQGAKSSSGIRTVDLPQLLVDYLKQQPHSSSNDYVVLTANGKLFTVTAWRRLWDSYLKDLNLAHGDFSDYEKKPKSKFDPKGVPFVIERFTAHYLRHTHATNLFHCGKDLLYVQQQLGHAKPETTLNIYTHLVKTKQIQKNSKIINFNTYINKIARASGD